MVELNRLPRDRKRGRNRRLFLAILRHLGEPAPHMIDYLRGVRQLAAWRFSSQELRGVRIRIDQLLRFNRDLGLEWNEHLYEVVPHHDWPVLSRYVTRRSRDGIEETWRHLVSLALALPDEWDRRNAISCAARAAISGYTNVVVTYCPVPGCECGSACVPSALVSGDPLIRLSHTVQAPFRGGRRTPPGSDGVGGRMTGGAPATAGRASGGAQTRQENARGQPPAPCPGDEVARRIRRGPFEVLWNARDVAGFARFMDASDIELDDAREADTAGRGLAARGTGTADDPYQID